jgi:NitT/TauT family transport system permease protein
MNRPAAGGLARGARFRPQHLLVWLVLLGVWQTWIWVSGIPELIAPSPAEVFGQLAHPGWLLAPLAATLGTALAGGLIGLAAGTALAVACWLVPLSRFLILPPALALCAVPLVVFAPVIGLIVGYGNVAVLTMTVVIALFPSFVFVDNGLHAITPTAMDLMRALGASRNSVLVHLALPSAVPSFALAVRITAATVILGAFTADYLVGSSGLGYLIAYEEYFVQSAQIWAACLVVIVASVALYLTASALTDRMTRRYQVS